MKNTDNKMLNIIESLNNLKDELNHITHKFSNRIDLLLEQIEQSNNQEEYEEELNKYTEENNPMTQLIDRINQFSKVYNILANAIGKKGVDYILSEYGPEAMIDLYNKALENYTESIEDSVSDDDFDESNTNDEDKNESSGFYIYVPDECDIDSLFGGNNSSSNDGNISIKKRVDELVDAFDKVSRTYGDDITQMISQKFGVNRILSIASKLK